MRTASRRIACVSALALWAGALGAQTSTEVILKSKDGSISVSGELIGIESGLYVIESHIGLVRIPVASVDCIGPCDLGSTTTAAVEPAQEPAPEPASAAVEPAAVAVAQPEPVVEAPKAVLTEAAAPVEQASAPQADVPASAKFGIHGSRTLGTFLLPNLIKAYAAKIGATYEMFDDNPKERIVRVTAADGTVIAEIDLQTKGSGSAFPGLGEGIADIGMADRRMKDDDLAKLGTLGELRDTPNEIVLGRDGIVSIVHPSNPLSDISFEDLSRIYSGEATNWSEFGGPDAPIAVHSFPDGSGDRAVFLSRAVDPFGKIETETAIEHQEYAEMRGAVAADPAAIGFLGRPFTTDEIKVLPIREQCGLVSQPSNFRMKTEGYAMSRRLYLYRKPGVIHPFAEELLAFALSPEGQQVLVDSNFVDNEIEGMRLADMSSELDFARTEPDFRPAAFDALLNDLGDAERLSIAFRFEFARATLDQLSERAVSDFAAKLQSGAFDGKEILVVGFADSVGRFEQNQRLAMARAEVVADLLSTRIGRINADKYGLKPVSFGELLPYLCNEDEFGRDSNRRVEIWVR